MKNHFHLIAIIFVIQGCNNNYQSKKILDLSKNNKFTIYPIYREGSMFHFTMDGYTNMNFKIKYYYFSGDMQKPYMTYIENFNKGEVKFTNNSDFYYSNWNGKIIIEFIPSCKLAQGELTISGYV